MTHKNFEDVPAWKDGIKLSTLIFKVTEDKAFRFKGDIANQLQCAGLSVPNNIAEGFERGTTQELITFLFYAKGSAGDVRSMTYVMDDLDYLAHLKSEISDIRSLARSISRQLSAWARSLQECDIDGPRYLTDKRKEGYQHRKRAEAFVDSLKQENETRLESLRASRGQ